MPPPRKKRAIKTGRPPVPAEDQRTVLIKVLVTPSEGEELAAAAAADDMTRSMWGRTVMLRAARGKK